MPLSGSREVTRTEKLVSAALGTLGGAFVIRKRSVDRGPRNCGWFKYAACPNPDYL